ncbi:MAG: glycosyltransferase [Geodermatophilaceae bacterium]|nr:glycosyltransferase [Geodermatophilaceae bacterium]
MARCEAGAGRNAIRARLGLGIDQPVVMTVGRLTHMKAQRNLIGAIPYLRSRVPDVAVVIVGDGPLRRQLEDQAASLGVGGATRFLGHRIDARSLLEAAGVFVLPSRHEGMPLAAIEAMAAGLPLVVTRVLGSREVVEDGKTGTLVPRDDPSALGPAVADLLTDEDRRKTYGAAGLRRYLESFTAQRMAARTHALYEHFLADACRVVDRPHIQP